MQLVDTSVWIEWLVDSPLAAKLVGKFPDRSECIVPTLVQHELAKWLLREKGEDAVDDIIAYTQKCIVTPLDTLTALEAAELCREHKLATADAIIYATALRYNATLLTCDAHFNGLPGVIYMAKNSV